MRILKVKSTIVDLILWHYIFDIYYVYIKYKFRFCWKKKNWQFNRKRVRFFEISRLQLLLL